jgi:conserved oligomeric Golgi complex subunit 3
VVVVADQLEASLIYTRFHGISTRSQRLLSYLRARSHKSVAYVDLLHTCRTTYCTCRESLLRQPLRDYMERLLLQHGAVGMARLASVFLMRLLSVETMLFLDFFGVAGTKEATTTAASKTFSSDASSDATADSASSSVKDSSVAAATTTTTMDKTFQDAEFQAYLATLCTSLHRTLRRSLVTCLDLDTLCQMVSVLRQEGQVAARNNMTLAAARSLAQVMQDAQERVIFCANTTLRREVLRWKASPSDLDYPKKLQVLQQNKMNMAATAAAATSNTTVAVADNEDDVNRAEQQLEQVYESWFPPMRTVLRILSKIFRVVEPSVFEDLALQSIQACTKSLKDGATFILKRQGVLHADLFLVKHLLILREQLSPFDMELRTVERQLDFSDAGKAVARFLANRNRRIFSMSTENNALMTLLREGVSVQESSVDSKRDLEEALKSACNDFIEHTSTSLAGPVLNLWEGCKMDKDKKSKTKNNHNADYIQDLLVNKTLQDLPSKMDNLLECMGLYLDNPATQSILLKPAIRKVTRATEGVRRWVQTQCAAAAAAAAGTGDDESGGWNAEKRAAILEALNRVDDLVKKVNNKPGVTTTTETATAAVATVAVAATPAVAAVVSATTLEAASSSS